MWATNSTVGCSAGARVDTPAPGIPHPDYTCLHHLDHLDYLDHLDHLGHLDHHLGQFHCWYQQMAVVTLLLPDYIRKLVEEVKVDFFF